MSILYDRILSAVLAILIFWGCLDVYNLKQEDKNLWIATQQMTAEIKVIEGFNDTEGLRLTNENGSRLYCSKTGKTTNRFVTFECSEKQQ